MSRVEKVRVRVVAEVELAWDEERAAGVNGYEWVRAIREALESRPDLLRSARGAVAVNALVAEVEERSIGVERDLAEVAKGVFEAVSPAVRGRFMRAEDLVGPMLLLDLLHADVVGFEVEPAE